MDKIIAIKVKNSGGTYDEIPITALAQNVYWSSDLDLNLKQHIIGDIDSVKDSNQNIIPLQTQINNLNNNKANIDSPTFTGTPKSVTPAATDNSTNIATTAFVKSQIAKQLTKDNLKTDVLSSLTSSASTSVSDRQYPVTFDAAGDLSVNVPWTDTIFSSPIENIWTGICESTATTPIKVITLDNNEDFPNSLTGNEILAIYFKEKNIAQTPKLKINNVEYSIGFLDQNGNVQLITTTAPFYTFGSGLKFFVYKADDNCWLLSNVDYSTISYLNNKKANLISPAFTGTPTSITPATTDNSTKIATTEFVKGQIANQLTKSDLQTTTKTNLNSMDPPSAMASRQYPVVFDSANKLSVNVPWIDAGTTINNIQKLWTGTCDNLNTVKNKTIILNNENDNYGGLITITDGNPSIAEKSTILIYFTQGNDTTTPTLTINGTTLEKDILYQNGPDSFSVMTDTAPYYQWGPGLKIFTYIKYDNNTKDGWLINSFDGLVIKNLNERLLTIETNINTKANINSPSLTGIPTSTTPDGTISSQIATAGYVQSESKKILNADENYAFQLKERNSNNNIFAVDWEGNANGVDLNCITTNNILKSRPETTIIGQYNAVTKNATGLFCGNEVYCADDLVVGGSDIYFDSGDYAFVIGNGIDNQHRSNLIRIVNSTGGIYINCPQVSINDFVYTSSRNPFALFLGDKDGNRIGGISYHVKPAGEGGIETSEQGIVLQGYRQVNNINYYNDLRLMIDSNGEYVVRVGSPTAWRKALDLQRSTISVRNIVVSGFLSNGSKDLTFTLPLNRIPYGTPKITNLEISLRGGDGQPYLYEVSGSNNNQYTQLGTNPVVIWENNKTKRVNGVQRVTAYNQAYTGLLVIIGFKNTLRKANSSTVVAQNNAPYGIQISGDISFT